MLKKTKIGTKTGKNAFLSLERVPTLAWNERCSLTIVRVVSARDYLTGRTMRRTRRTHTHSLTPSTVVLFKTRNSEVKPGPRETQPDKTVWQVATGNLPHWSRVYCRSKRNTPTPKLPVHAFHEARDRSLRHLVRKKSLVRI